MSNNTATVIIVCSVLTLIAWIAWLFRPERVPGWLKKLRRKMAEDSVWHEPAMWQSKTEKTYRTDEPVPPGGPPVPEEPASDGSTEVMETPVDK